jgi:hypothetical protein
LNPRTIIAVAVVLLLAGTLAGYLYGVSSIPKTTTTTTARAEVADSFAKHMLLLSERNATNIVSQYEGDANLTWVGRAQNVGGLGGVYNKTDILILMNFSFIGRAGSFGIGNLSHKVAQTSKDSATVQSGFEFFGSDYTFGPYFNSARCFNGTVSAQTNFAYSGPTNAWLISRELWNFTSLNLQC